MTIKKGNKIFDVSIDLAFLSNDRYFQLVEKVPEIFKRIQMVTLDAFAPFAELGKELAVARHGYKERDDWREATRDSDYINAVKSLLLANGVYVNENDDNLLDDDEGTCIELVVTFNGSELKTKAFFREETKAEMDEFLAATSNEPRKNVLASAKKYPKNGEYLNYFRHSTQRLRIMLMTKFRYGTRSKRFIVP